jgi:hypothetical protein
MTRRPPGRRRPAPSHPGFDPREIDVDMDVCRWCGAHVPADERRRVQHEEWDQRIVGRFLELADQLARLSPSHDQMSGSAVHAPPSAPAGPDPKSPPTPSQQANDVRGGVEGANDPTQPVAPSPLRGDGTPRGAPSPASRGAKGAGRGDGGSGKEPEPTPAGTDDPEQADLLAYERALASGWRSQ